MKKKMFLRTCPCMLSAQSRMSPALQLICDSIVIYLFDYLLADLLTDWCIEFLPVTDTDGKHVSFTCCLCTPVLVCNYHVCMISYSAPGVPIKPVSVSVQTPTRYTIHPPPTPAPASIRSARARAGPVWVGGRCCCYCYCVWFFKMDFYALPFRFYYYRETLYTLTWFFVLNIIFILGWCYISMNICICNWLNHFLGDSSSHRCSQFILIFFLFCFFHFLSAVLCF